jgi:hypothetical protein
MKNREKRCGPRNQSGFEEREGITPERRCQGLQEKKQETSPHACKQDACATLLPVAGI